MNDLKGIIKDLSNSMLVDNDFFLKLGLSDEEADNSYNGCTTEGEIIIMLKNQQQELDQLKAEKSGEWVDVERIQEIKIPFVSQVGSLCYKIKLQKWTDKKCGDCGAMLGLANHENYCPKCGAKMEERE